MLMGDTGKYFGIVAGVMFASLLLVQQLAMFAGIMGQMYAGISAVSADIWVMDPKVRYIDDSQPMTDGQLARVRSVEGVAWAVKLYKGTVQAKLGDGSNIGVALYGLDDATFIGGPAVMVEGKLEHLRRSDAVIVDVQSAQDKLGRTLADGTKAPLRVGDTLELNDRRVIVAGLCEVARGFQSMPVVYTTYNRALSIVPPQRKNLSFILATPKSGETADAVSARVKRVTGLAAYTSQQFIVKTVTYFVEETGVVISFALSVFIAFLIGTLIAGQTFYNFTMDNLRHFGALKAMGATNRTLLSMIVLQASFVGVLGFGTGTGFACLMGLGMRSGVVTFTLPWYVLAVTGVVVIAIVTIAAAFSLRKVVRLEPGIVFRG
ncbi:ABC transporter permease [Bryobacterales bacterium F-183]|nr:ABC transporter permease [Bryobacterales bacterium F-183]